MPKYYARHLPPPTICHRFSPEPEAVPFTPTIVRAFAPEARKEVVYKPLGDVSKHYRLKNTIGLADAEFKAVQSDIHEAAREILDITKGYNAQDESAVELLCQKIVYRYPYLDNFADHWVVKDFLKMFLKNTSARARYKGPGRRRSNRHGSSTTIASD